MRQAWWYNGGGDNVDDRRHIERHIINSASNTQKQKTSVRHRHQRSKSLITARFRPAHSLVSAIEPGRRLADRHLQALQPPKSTHLTVGSGELFLRSLFSPGRWVVCRHVVSHAVSLSLVSVSHRTFLACSVLPPLSAFHHAERELNAQPDLTNHKPPAHKIP
jgi:hypothetical protein